MILALTILFGIISQIQCKTCDCGRNCEKFEGVVTKDDVCIFIARRNSLYGKQFVVTNSEEESLLINHLLKGIPSSDNLSVSTDMGYKFETFTTNCLAHFCEKTVYKNKCTCELSLWEQMIEQIKSFYHNYNEFFWIAVSALIVVFLAITLKCVTFCFHQK